MPRNLIFTLLCCTAVGCGSASSDAATDRDVAAQAAEAARAVAATDHSDTLALQSAIVDARAMHDRYLLTGNPEAAEQFEQAFADSLRVYDPQIANEIFNQQ